jgi:hypothetical protein
MEIDFEAMFECILWKTLETISRQNSTGGCTMLDACNEHIDADTWRVRMQHYSPVGRFRASDYVTTRDCFKPG